MERLSVNVETFGKFMYVRQRRLLWQSNHHSKHLQIFSPLPDILLLRADLQKVVQGGGGTKKRRRNKTGPRFEKMLLLV